MTRQSLVEIPPIQIPTPFKEVWLPLPTALLMKSCLEQIWQSGRWGVVIGPPQSGKSMLTTHCYDNCGAFRDRDGESRQPVAHGMAAGNGLALGRGLLYTIAYSLGGFFYANQPNLLWKLPIWITKLGTTLLIVNDAHDLSAQEWVWLEKIHNTSKGLGHEFAVALLGVRRPARLALRRNPYADQIHNRITDYWEVGGHKDEQIGDALELLCRQYAPVLYREQLHKRWRTVRDKFAKSLESSEISAQRLMLVVLWASGYRASLPDLSVDAVTKEATKRVIDGILAGTARARPEAETEDETERAESTDAA